MGMIKKQWNQFWLAIQFFTRFPTPDVDYSPEALNKSSKFFSLIGWMIGGLLAVSYFFLSEFLYQDVLVWLILGLGMLLTGAFHEDGLGDSFDGLWGGMDPEKRISIMKDSRVGTYGLLAHLVVFSLKGFSLIHTKNVIGALLVGHVLSRALASLYIFIFPYYQHQASKSKPLAERIGVFETFLVLIIAMPVIYFVSLEQMLWLALSLTLVFIIWGAVIKRKIGGFTGDLLGASQQLFETTIFIILGLKIWS